MLAPFVTRRASGLFEMEQSHVDALAPSGKAGMEAAVFLSSICASHIILVSVFRALCLQFQLSRSE